MAWISQNWWFVLLLVGLVYWMYRSGMGGGFGGGSHQHGGGHEGDVPQSVTKANVDPVSGETVDMTIAAATVYQGKTYYFASKENRDRFEAAPEQYAAKAHDEHEEEHSHRHGGCC